MSADPYRVPAPRTECDPYMAAWANIRRRRRLAWLSFLAFLPVGGLTMVTVEWLFGNGAGVYPGIAPLAWVMFTSASFMNSRCPNCTKPFFRTWFFRNAFSRKCLHCGIAIGTPKLMLER